MWAGGGGGRLSCEGVDVLVGVDGVDVWGRGMGAIVGVDKAEEVGVVSL